MQIDFVQMLSSRYRFGCDFHLILRLGGSTSKLQKDLYVTLNLSNSNSN